MSTQNRCQRCGRKLSDPQATYGWRCAEKLGVSEAMSGAPYEIFRRFTEGMEKAERMFGKLFKNSPQKLKDILSSMAKISIWTGTNDKKAEKEKSNLFKLVDGTKIKNKAINLIEEISEAAKEFRESVGNKLYNTVSEKSKNLAKNGRLDDITNKILKTHDSFNAEARLFNKSGNFTHCATTAIENYEYNSKVDLSSYKNKYINDQNSGPVSNLKFGNRYMDYNGCEIIAVYNTLLTLGKKEDIRDLAFHFENDGQMLGGEFGTNPYAALRYFENKGYDVKTVKGEDIVNKKPPKADAYILSYWNTDNVMDALHTVAIRKENDGSFTFYNDDSRKQEEIKVDSISNRIESKDYQPIILQCISKKDVK